MITAVIHLNLTNAGCTIRIRYGIRFILIVTTLFASIFAWIAYQARCGRLEWNAAAKLRNGGVIALQSEYADSIHTGTSSWSNELSVLDPFKPTQPGFLQRLLGDEFHIRFSTLVIYNKPAIEMFEIESCIQDLTNLNTVYIDPTALTQSEIEHLQTEFPNLQYQIRPTLIPISYMAPD